MAEKKRYTKQTLPEKICLICKRPMQWRKSWEKNWDSVKYCSDRCRKNAAKVKNNSKEHA